jgi:hypothetical protein
MSNRELKIGNIYYFIMYMKNFGPCARYDTEHKK